MSIKKVLSLVIIPMLYTMSFSQVTHQQIDNLTSHLLTSNRLYLSGEIQVNAFQSWGVAAIKSNPNYAIIYVSPIAMYRFDYNSWAFIIGHELSHHFLRHTGQGNKYREQEADVWGARMAENAGFNSVNYILALEREPNSCSPTHGCFHERIYNLKVKMNFPFPFQFDAKHQGHRPAHGPFPKPFQH